MVGELELPRVFLRGTSCPPPHTHIHTTFVTERASKPSVNTDAAVRSEGGQAGSLGRAEAPFIDTISSAPQLFLDLKQMQPQDPACDVTGCSATPGRASASKSLRADCKTFALNSSTSHILQKQIQRKHHEDKVSEEETRRPEWNSPFCLGAVFLTSGLTVSPHVHQGGTKTQILDHKTLTGVSHGPAGLCAPVLAPAYGHIFNQRPTTRTIFS